MSLNDLFPLAGIATAVAAWLLWRIARSGQGATDTQERSIAALVAVSIALMLVAFANTGAITGAGIRLSLVASAAVATMLVQVIYLVGLLKHGIRGLGLLLLPVTALPLLAVPVLPEEHNIALVPTTSVLETGHLLVSLAAYALLTLAALHALMYLWLNRALKMKQLTPVLQSMPSLFEVENHLFAQVRWTVWLLGIAILTGLAWQWVEFSHFALLNHKVLLALFSFLTLIVLLVQRKKAAWHGKRASGMVLAAYVLLLLAYFGVKLIHSWQG